MKAIALFLLAATTADFQMLQAPPRGDVSYHMLAGPEERPVARDGTVHETDDEGATSADALPNARSRLLLVYTAAWCRPCRRFREDVLPKLEAAGWEIGPEATNHIQLIAVGSDLPAGIDAVPTFVLVEGDRQTRRHVGWLDAWGVGELVKGYSERPRTTSARFRTRSPGSARFPVVRQMAVPRHRQRCRRCGRFHAALHWR